MTHDDDITVQGQQRIADFVRTLPGKPGVYRMINAQGDVLYVGKAKNLKKRVTAYTQMTKHPVRIQRMIFETQTMEFITTHTEAEALLLEADLIKKLRPRYNILLRDDKSFPYIHITDHPFPQIAKHRGSRNKKGKFFGPFATVGAVNKTLTILQKAFMLRNCSDNIFKSRTRPCLQYQIKRCTAPCVDYVTKEQYAEQLSMAQDFLMGKNRAIQNKFAQKMQAASTDLDFETAALYRDRIQALTKVQSQHTPHSHDLNNADVIAIHAKGAASCVQVFFYRGGQSFGNRAYFPRHENNADPTEILSAFISQFYTNKPIPKVLYINLDLPEQNLIAEALSHNQPYSVNIKTPKRGKKRELIIHVEQNAKQALERKQISTFSHKKCLEDLMEIFDLDDLPTRIEIYDNSHIQGSHPIGAMVVTNNEGFDKAQYRKFNIRDPNIAQDDYGMMREVFTRRFSRALKEDPDRQSLTWPNLVLIDGGQGQLSAVSEALDAIGIHDIPLVAIAKGPDRNAGRERFFMPGRAPFSLPINDPTLHFIQRLRDEAHRFAIGSHRTRRKASAFTSELDRIHGIGPSKKKALLLHFGSLEAIKQAGIHDLQNVDGISKTMAKNIYDRFHDGV